MEGRDQFKRGVGLSLIQKANHRSRLTLRPHRKWPRSGRATEQRDEVAPSHSITSSAATSSVEGMVTPSDFAVLPLITNLNRVGCSTGRSAGLAPFSIL